MPASISAHPIPGGRWLVVEGSREAAFEALGEEARETIRDLVATCTGLDDDLPGRLASSSVLSRRYEAVAENSRSQYPEAWSELERLAVAAGVDFQDLLLINLRGDLGSPDGTGCTDMVWTDGSVSLLAHNEDGDSGFLGRCHLLTLVIDDDPALTTWWYPCFLPSNTFSFNEYGLCIGTNHVSVKFPAAAPGRHFVARSLQKATDLDAFTDLMQTSPFAGGYGFTAGSMGSGGAIGAEAAAGSVVVRPVDAESVDCVWHTNHLRMLDSVPDKPSEESLARGKRLSALTMPEKADREWMLELLSEDPVIGGIRPDGAGDIATLSTVVYDLTGGEVIVKVRNSRPIVIPANQPSLGQPIYELLHPDVRGPSSAREYQRR